MHCGNFECYEEQTVHSVEQPCAPRSDVLLDEEVGPGLLKPIMVGWKLNFYHPYRTIIRIELLDTLRPSNAGVSTHNTLWDKFRAGFS